MKRKLVVSIIVITLASTAAINTQVPAAAARPNFSGTWTLVPDPNMPAAGRGGGLSGLGQAFSAAQDEQTLTVTTRNSQMDGDTIVYTFDGSETKNPLSVNGMSVDRNSKAKWHASSLVITTTAKFNGDTLESTMTLSFDALGSLIVESAANVGGNRPMTIKATYRRVTPTK